MKEDLTGNGPNQLASQVFALFRGNGTQFGSRRETYQAPPMTEGAAAEGVAAENLRHKKLRKTLTFNL
jgi:hypothetical protein